MRIFSTLILLFFQLMLTAQTGEWTEFSPPDKVNCLAVQGNTILVGTQGSGIVALDTTGNRSYYHTGNSDLPTDTILLLATDQDGHWWMHHSGAITRFNGASSQTWSLSQTGLPANSIIRAIKVSPDNSIYVASSNGVAIYQNSSWSVLNTSNSGLPTNSVNDIAFGLDGKRFYGTAGSGISEQNGANWTVYNSTNTGISLLNYILSLTVTSDSALWVVGGVNLLGVRLARFGSGNWTGYTGLSIGIPDNPNLSRVTADNTGRLCLLATKSISILGKEGAWTHYSNEDLACRPDFFIPAVVDGADAFCAWSDCELLRLGASGWKNIETGLPGHPLGIMLDAIGEDANGNFWFGAVEGNCIASFNGNTWSRFYPKQFGALTNDVYSVQAGTDGSMWFGLDLSEILRYHNNEWTLFDTCALHFPGCVVLTSVEAPNGDRWFSFFPGSSQAGDAGLALLTAAGQWQFFVPGQANYPVIPSAYIRKILIEPNGTLWIPTGAWGDSGIFRYNGTTWDAFNVSNSGLPSDRVYHLAQAPDGAIWAATNAGLARYDGQNWTVFTTSNSEIPSNLVYRVAFDKANGMYIGFVPDPPSTPGPRVAEYRNGVWTELVPPSWYQSFISETDAFFVDSHNRLWFNKFDDYLGKVYRYDPMLVNTKEPRTGQSLLTIMPNPTSAETLLQWEQSLDGEFRINITNAYGQEVYEHQVVIAADAPLPLDISNVPAGIYWLSVKGANGTLETKKIIKQ